MPFIKYVNENSISNDLKTLDNAMSIAHMYNAPIPVLDLKDSVIRIHL